ncbi:hypothetical protein [Patiriisocius marinus]|uniref:Uncharacterized protein n=1 Tax=Patiriisocius marinus TaxID=1397112 RepID=A0A5J4IXV3_9FLAO|nr:hypothetical protein [Patiriisocius marinus]GER58401.1 hypothetical protein ULMA_05090 [Patiriisocius marinus]
MKTFKNLSAYVAAAAMLFLSSCGNDDDFSPVDSGEDGEVNLELNGILDSDRILDPTQTYTVTGSYLVKSGAKLTIPAGTEIVSQVATNNYIAIEKGAQIDVQGTASLPVIMRSTSGNQGDWGGLVILGDAVTTEGVDAIAEVGGFIYGGTNSADNSGSINYLIIKNAGAQINSESQYNGLTLYAVGNGTSINNVALMDGADDGVEFFGGSVSVTNLYAENNQDDSIDWTEGWNGSITNTYVVHNNDGFSTAIEADGDNGNPTITNFTAVSTVGGTALQFKKMSGATINGLSLTGYETSIDMKDDGPLANVIIEGASADPFNGYTTSSSVDVSIFDWVNSNQTGNASLLQGVVNGTVTLDANVAYTLTSSYIVQDGGKLIIPAGTKITANASGTSVYIAVLKGGQIEINGTADNPVIMSSATATPGDWGGLTICGDAPTTEGTDATAEIGGFIYGGNNAADDSGSINYLVMLGTGAQINSESQYNGISFYAVGSETEVNNVAIINGADDGVEFFGGAVNATNIYLENNEDDAVDWTEGWNGALTNTFVTHTNGNFSTALEADGDNGNPTLNNFTAITTSPGTALQFKKMSGATMTNVLLSGYDTNVDMKDDGPVSNVIIDGTPLTTATDDVFNGTAVDISGWAWITARL